MWNSVSCINYFISCRLNNQICPIKLFVQIIRLPSIQKSLKYAGSDFDLKIEKESAKNKIVNLFNVLWASLTYTYFNRELKQRRRRRLGRRLVKNEFIFYCRISQMPRSVQCVYRSQNLLKLNM